VPTHRRTQAAKALLLLAATSLPPNAAAQQAEQITVAAPGVKTSPVSTTTLSAGDINASGVSSLGALLDQQPSLGSQGVNNAQNERGFGEYFINLRNLNFDRTLVLVDGKRFTPSGIQTDEAVDLNDIPLGFIDHVEILKDGSQPQYAADAVAGAVNMVLKDQIDGWIGRAIGCCITGCTMWVRPAFRNIPGHFRAWPLSAVMRVCGLAPPRRSIMGRGRSNGPAVSYRVPGFWARRSARRSVSSIRISKRHECWRG
jgi:hypothetical protein